jgi:hypothetical protein
MLGSGQAWQGLFEYNGHDRFALQMFERVLRRTGRWLFTTDVGADAHSAFSALTRRYRDLNLEVRVKLSDRRGIVELAPFRGNAWPPGW